MGVGTRCSIRVFYGNLDAQSCILSLADEPDQPDSQGEWLIRPAIWMDCHRDPKSQNATQKKSLLHVSMQCHAQSWRAFMQGSKPFCYISHPLLLAQTLQLVLGFRVWWQRRQKRKEIKSEQAASTLTSYLHFCSCLFLWVVRRQFDLNSCTALFLAASKSI